MNALDTLWLMDMKDDFYEARDWVSDKLDHDKDKDASPSGVETGHFLRRHRTLEID